MTSRVKTLALLLAGSLVTTTAFADEVSNPWYLNLSTGGVSYDGDRNVGSGGSILSLDSDSHYFGIGIGRFFSPNFSMELEFDRYSADFTGAHMIANGFGPQGDLQDDLDFQAYSLNGRYFFNDVFEHVSPYALFGINRVDHDSVFDDRGDFGVNLGLGLQGNFNHRVGGRAQIMYRFDRDDNTIPTERAFGDLILSLGLNIAFGSKPAAPAAAAVAAAATGDADSDGDGVIDANDRCPGTPAGVSVDRYGCPLDSDGDGVADYRDRCPGTAAGIEVNSDGCPADSDGDGVPNHKDKCPNTRAGAVVDLDGCEVDKVISLRGVHFDFDRATLKSESIAILDEAAGLLNHHGSVVVEVAGHTDSLGPDSYNQRLSESRAKVVRDYLVGKGVSATRLQARGYGESRPIASNDTEEGRAENRRTELIILSK